MNEDKKSGILYKKWESRSPKALFLLVHGLGAFSGRWAFLTDFFLRHNISSYAIDLRGFGETEGLKGHIDSFDAYFNDIQSLYDIIKSENDAKKVYLIGESMGALVSFLLAGLKPDLFDGLICISPAFKDRLKFSLLDYLKVFVMLIFNPRKQFKMPFDSRMCTRDTDYQKVMDADWREHRLATPKLLLNILIAEMRVHSLKDKIRIPVLFLIAGEYDELVDPEKAESIFKSLKTRDKKIIRYPEMRHALSIELGREKIFEDILEWVNKKIQGECL